MEYKPLFENLLKNIQTDMNHKLTSITSISCSSKIEATTRKIEKLFDNNISKNKMFQMIFTLLWEINIVEDTRLKFKNIVDTNIENILTSVNQLCDAFERQKNTIIQITKEQNETKLEYDKQVSAFTNKISLLETEKKELEEQLKLNKQQNETNLEFAKQVSVLEKEKQKMEEQYTKEHSDTKLKFAKQVYAFTNKISLLETENKDLGEQVKLNKEQHTQISLLEIEKKELEEQVSIYKKKYANELVKYQLNADKLKNLITDYQKTNSK